MEEFEYRAQFQGATQSTGFSPITAPDITPQLRANAQTELNEMAASAKFRMDNMKQQEEFRKIYEDDRLKALANFSTTLSKAVMGAAAAKAKEDLQLGLNDDLKYGLPADQAEDKAAYDEGVKQLKAGDDQVRNALIKHPAPEEAKQEVRYASGWRGYGQKLQALTKAGQKLKNVLEDAFETDKTTQIPDPLKPGEFFTPIEARSKGSAYVEAAIDVISSQHSLQNNVPDHHRFMVDNAYNPEAKKSRDQVSQNMRSLVVKDRRETAKDEAKREVVTNMLVKNPSTTSLSDAIVKYSTEGGVSMVQARQDIIKAIVEAQGNNVISPQQAFNTFNQEHPPTKKPFAVEFALEIAAARREMIVNRAQNEDLKMKILKQEAKKNALATLQELRDTGGSVADANKAGKMHRDAYGLETIDEAFINYAANEAPEILDYNEKLKQAEADGKAGILTNQRIAEEYPMLVGEKKLTPYIKSAEALSQLPSEMLEAAADNIEDHVNKTLDLKGGVKPNDQDYSIGIAKLKMTSRLKTLALQFYQTSGNAEESIEKAQHALIGEFNEDNDKKSGQFYFKGKGSKAMFPAFSDPTGSQMRSAEDARLELYEIQVTAGTYGLSGLKNKEDTLDMWSQEDLQALAANGRTSSSAGLVKIDQYVRAHNRAYPNNVITHDEAIDTLLNTHGITRTKRKKDEYEDAARQNGLLQNMLERAGHGGSSQVAVAGGLPPATIRTGFEGTADVVQTAIHYKMPPGVAPIAGAVYGLESAYGTKPSGQNNFFGIKGQGTVRTTTEYDGVVTEASFRDYATPHESVADFVKLINDDPRYSAVKNAKTPREAAVALKAAGYATDPDYSDKVTDVLTDMGVNLDMPYTNTRLVADSPYSDTSTLGPAACQFITGNTGTSTGPHVHVGVNKTSGVNSKIDPSPYVNRLFVGDKPLTEVYKMTSPYGPRTHPVHGTYGFHKGIDYATPTGTRITVRGAQMVDKFYDPTGGGNTTACRLPTGEEILLMHGS